MKKDGTDLGNEIGDIDGAAPTGTDEEKDNALAGAIANGANRENDAPVPPVK